MKIKLIGSDCKNGIKLKKNIFKVCKEGKNNLEIELLDVKSGKDKYNISSFPALVIDNKVISQGKVLTDRQIKHYIEILE